MKVSYLMLVLLSCTFYVTAQPKETTALYDEYGRLFLDSSLVISPSQLAIWQHAEKNLLFLFAENIKFSTLARENEFGGITIAAFDFENGIVNNLRTVKKLGAGLDEEALIGVKKTIPHILTSFDIAKTKTGVIDGSGTYYIPVEFEAYSILERSIKQRAVPVLDKTQPLYITCD